MACPRYAAWGCVVSGLPAPLPPPGAPGSAEWSRRMTASKVAGVLGLSKWASPYSTWLRMKGLLPSDDGRNMSDKARGHYLEDGVVRWWIDQHVAVRSRAALR